jgi:plastocyanin
MNRGVTSLGLKGLHEELGNRAPRNSRFALMLAVGLTALLAVSCSSSKASPNAAASVHASSKPAPPPPTVTITVHPAGFDPSAVTTTVEGNIVWTQGDAKAHTITSGDPGKPDGKFESGPLAKGSSFTLVLHTAGTYHYFDKNYPTLSGQIVVRPH